MKKVSETEVLEATETEAIDNEDITIDEIVDISPYFDDLYVGKKDPEFVYRWLNNSPANISKKLRYGYEIIRRSKDSPKEKPILELQGQVDSLRRSGDLVLSKIPKKLYEKRMAAKKLRGEQLRRNIDAEVKEKSMEMIRQGAGKMEVFNEISKIIQSQLRDMRATIEQ